MGEEYTLFLLEDREGKPVAVLLPSEAVAAQEQVLPQARDERPYDMRLLCNPRAENPQLWEPDCLLSWERRVHCRLRWL